MNIILRACLIVKFHSFLNAPIKFPSAPCVISLTPLSFTPFVDFALSLVFSLPCECVVCVVWSLSAIPCIIEQKVAFDSYSASGNPCVSETFMLVLKKGHSVFFFDSVKQRFLQAHLLRFTRVTPQFRGSILFRSFGRLSVIFISRSLGFCFNKFLCRICVS